MSAPKDGVVANTHPSNLSADGTPSTVDRIPLYEVYMRMAEELAKRSTCVRLQVGTVVTDQRLENVLAIGYNGNAREDVFEPLVGDDRSHLQEIGRAHV